MSTTEAPPVQELTETRDGMIITWDAPIEMDDGVVLRADVFRPITDYAVPVLLSYGPYGKGMWFPEHHADQWQRLVAEHPDVLAGSTSKYQAWETADPEKWVPHGYACVRVDSRGAGRSPGFLDPHSPREIADTSQCVEWAAAQPWSNGKVGMLGISYYATNAWLTAAQAQPPPHLAAICPWEGSADMYRDVYRHGGILTSTWVQNWWSARILSVQHGVGERGARNPNTGELAAGPETVTDDELAANRADFLSDFATHTLDDEWVRARSVDWDNVRLPFLSAANWGSAALHLRGNLEGYVRAASKQKWLEVHGLEHWTHFYTDYGLDIQRRFFDRFLKEDDSGWAGQPRVVLNVRRPDKSFDLRAEADWPIPDTRWTRLYLDVARNQLAWAPPETAGSTSFRARGDGIQLRTPPMRTEVEITGPVAAKLFVSSSTTDADLFLVLHVFDPDGVEVTFQGALDPRTCVAKGWLRASHRKLDPRLSRDYRPYHTHDEIQPLIAGQIYELDVEVWPTSIVVPVGCQIGLSILGRDFRHPPEDVGTERDYFGQRGVEHGSGPFLHDDPEDRPRAVFDGETTVHSEPERPAFLLLPLIPPRG